MSALRAEWTKAHTTPGTIWLLLAVVASTVGVTAMTAGSLGADAVDPVRVSLTGVQLGQAVVAILAVLGIGSEYSTGMVNVTLAAIPRRMYLLAAKATILTGAVIAAATVAVLGSLATGWLLLPGLSLGSVLRPAAGSVLYLVLVGLLSLGVGVAVRNSAAAVGVVLGLLYLFPILSLAVSDEDWQRHLEQAGPMSAGLAIQATVGLDDLPIDPWRGLGVLAGWACGAMLAGALRFAVRRRAAR
jgi:ABC-2 type transport system permease protein